MLSHTRQWLQLTQKRTFRKVATNSAMPIASTSWRDPNPSVPFGITTLSRVATEAIWAMQERTGRQPGMQRNVFGDPLTSCSEQPLTGFYRSGCCHTGPEDVGLHTVCVEVTADFLAFSKARGNDLSTPRPEFGFPGLKAGIAGVSVLRDGVRPSKREEHRGSFSQPPMMARLSSSSLATSSFTRSTWLSFTSRSHADSSRRLNVPRG